MTTSHLAPFGTALVIGASIGGSSAAAALAPHFKNVVVVDRDDIPEDPAKRKGVPHSYQFHTLTVGGRLALEEIFPGLTEDLRDAGVPWSDPAKDTRYASKFGWFARQPSEMRMLQPTRRYLEWYLRKRAKNLDNVTVVPSTKVNGLSVEGGSVRGVVVVGPDGGERTLAADLVVDTSGRASQAPTWLAAAGYPEPVETTVNARWGYATTYVTVPDGWDPGYKSLYMGPTVSGEGASATRGAALWPQENNQVVITAQGCAGDLPPGDLDSLKEYLGSFGTSEFVDLITEFGASAPVEAWRNTTNRLRDYAGLTRRPEGFVVLGDAAAAFNPIYGQGMAMAAVGGRALGRAIAERRDDADLTGFAADFQKQLAELLTPCWEFSTGSDFNVPGVEVDGKPLETGKSEAAEYGDRVLALACEDPALSLKFMETVNLVRGVEWMADQDVRDRVLAEWDRLGAKKREPEA